MGTKQSARPRPLKVVAEHFIEYCVHQAFEGYFRTVAKERPRGNSGSVTVVFTDALRRRVARMEAAERANGWRKSAVVRST